MSAKKTGGCVRKDGYILITENGKRKYLHRHIMEQFLGRELQGEENIHHVNHNRSDNRIENLKLYKTRSEHTKFEKHKRISKYNQNDFKFCKGCGEKFYRYQKKHKFKNIQFCSHKCFLLTSNRNYHGYFISEKSTVE